MTVPSNCEMALQAYIQAYIIGIKFGDTVSTRMTRLYLNGSNSLENNVKLFEDFYTYAGLKFNIDKTEIIWLGRNNGCGKICNIKITQEPVKVLGIWISKKTS